MNRIEMLYLSQQEVIDAGLELTDAIDIVEAVLREHGEGRYENPPKPGVHPLHDAFLHAMPGYLPRMRAAGLKWVGGFSSNPARGLPTITGLIVLNDVATGLPTAVMDCAYITALRTAAVSAVAAKYLANRDARVLGIAGAGVQGRYNLLMLAQVLPDLQVARVYDPDAAALERYVESMGRRVGFRVEAGVSAEAVLRGADVAVTATGVLDEVLFVDEWVRREGVLVLPIHSRGWELKALREADKFVVDDWQQFHAVLFGPGGFYENQPAPTLHAQLGEVVCGARPGRQCPRERIVTLNFGMAIHDVAMATEVLRRARAKGMGTSLLLQDGALPYV